MNDKTEIINKLGFDNFNLNENLLKGVYLHGFTKPSKIQINGIQSINTGKDCLLQSQSGTGKTATYLLGILNRLDENSNNSSKCQAIILVPTRELADQVLHVAQTLSKYTKLKCIKCIGGTNIVDDINNIKKNHLIIGTIGRIFHLISEKKFNINNIKFIIIDEADDMFKYGANNQNEKIEDIINLCSQSNNIQLCMISATITDEVELISNKIMHNPIKILLEPTEVVVDLISQYYISIEKEDDKFCTLLDLYSLISTYQAIIFCNAINKVEYIKHHLEKENFEIAYIHGQMNQLERDEVLKKFRNGDSRILLSTDLLSRGIDIPQVNLVINYDLPLTKEDYIHRIGRCGRFDKKGIAISMININNQFDNKILFNMTKHYNMNISELPNEIDKLLD